MMTALMYLNDLRPALPLSAEKPATKDRPCQPMSIGELRRLINQGGVLFNGERVKADELIDFPVFSLVIFPKSPTKRCTLV